MWIATTSTATPGTVGSSGKVWAFTDDYATEIPLPADVMVTKGRASFASWVRGVTSRKYICGAASDNLVFTENKALLRLSIEAPTGPILDTASPTGNQIGFQKIAGGGLTGNIILYLRFYDVTNGRRSGLSGGGPITAFVGQGASFSAVPLGPDSPDPAVTHIEVWASQDGGLPRFWFRRDIGETTFSGNDTSLGEAELETTADFPVCKYNAIYHDRQVMAGDDRHPERVYFSVSEDPESYVGLYLTTRNGEAVIGLAVVRDTLVVQCDQIHYYIQGYDENDLSMNILEPNIGGLGHATIAKWNDVLVIPGTLGWYLCDGTSMRPIGEGIFDETWRRSIAENDYKNDSWAIVDNVSGIVKLCVRGEGVSIYGFPTSVYTDWVIDLRGGNPSLGFDTYLLDRSAGAILADPGFNQPQFYCGTSTGKVYIENQMSSKDGPQNIIHRLYTNHQVVAEPIDNSDCVRFVKGWLVLQNEYVAVTAGFVAGNEYSWRAATPNDTRTIAAQLLSQAVGATSTYMVANDRNLAALSNCSGSAVTLRLTCTNSGFTVLAPMSAQPNMGAFFFKGWGVDFSGDGEQFRNPEIAVP